MVHIKNNNKNIKKKEGIGNVVKYTIANEGTL